MKKIKFANMNITLSIISAFFSVLMLVLILNFTDNDTSDLGEGLALVFGMLFYVIFLFGQAAACIYIIIEALVIKSAVKKDKEPKNIFIVGGIIKIILAAACVVMTVIVAALNLLLGALAISLLAVFLVLSAIVGFKCLPQKQKTE